MRVVLRGKKRYDRWSVAGYFLTAIGVFLVGFFGGSMVHQVVASRSALQEFDSARVVVKPDHGSAPIQSQFRPLVDLSLWSDQRIHAYLRNLAAKKVAPLAVLRFERLNLRVPVFEGTDDKALSSGAGWIAGTTRPGEMGNIGIAAHRDSFFRALKDIRKGDVLELASGAVTDEYTVDQIEIVSPENVSVLRPRPVSSLTLVTCYPFYFVGAAPSRYIVHAAIYKQAGASKLWN